MKINKLKSISIAACCLVISLWSEAQCAQQNNSTFEDLCPGINITGYKSLKETISFNFQENVSQLSKKNFSRVINNNPTFLNALKEKFKTIVFRGLNDNCITIVNENFKKLLENKINCSIVNCMEHSKIDQLLKQYYSKYPEYITVFRDDHNTFASYCEPYDPDKDPLLVSENGFYMGGGGYEFSDYDENHSSDKQSFIENLRENSNNQ